MKTSNNLQFIIVIEQNTSDILFIRLLPSHLTLLKWSSKAMHMVIDVVFLTFVISWANINYTKVLILILI